jgi:hypothetical protein
MVNLKINSMKPESIKSLQNTHDLMLEALRHREQEMVKYLAILVPALGAYGWLIKNAIDDKNGLFLLGTIGVILLLFLGAIYSLSLGYNFRYVVMQLAKLEDILQISDAMLVKWPRTEQDIINRYRRCNKPWCEPPELIKVFWITFLIGILGVAVSACIIKPEATLLWILIPIGALCICYSGICLPIRYGVKLHNSAKAEYKEKLKGKKNV